MKRLSFLKWLPPVLLCAIAIYYSIYRYSSETYWDGAIGNWLATLLGIIVGAPVALFMERKREDSVLKTKKEEEKNILKSILTLIDKKLSENQEMISSRLQLEGEIMTMPVKISNWEALKASGDLRYLSNQNLLGIISDTYRMIELVLETEKQIYKTIYGVNVIFSDGENASTKLMKDAKNFQTISSIQLLIARTHIKNELSSKA